MKTKLKVTVLVAAVFLITGFAVTESSHPQTRAKLVGTWIVYMDHLPDVPPLLFTFHQDGTLIGSVPGDCASNAHGVWKKVSPRTYNCTQMSYVFGENCKITYIQKANFRIVVSKDGMSSKFEVWMQTMLPDGTVVKEITETDTAVRMTVEPYQPPY
jgi:hypothetical protein